MAVKDVSVRVCDECSYVAETTCSLCGADICQYHPVVIKVPAPPALPPLTNISFAICSKCFVNNPLNSLAQERIEALLPKEED